MTTECINGKKKYLEGLGLKEIYHDKKLFLCPRDITKAWLIGFTHGKASGE